MHVNEKLRYNTLLVVIAAMFTGLLFTRSGLSVSSALFVVVAWSNGEWKNNFRKFISNPYYLLLTALFFIPLVSGFWSSDSKEWWFRILVKLPLLLFPLAFAAMPAIKEQHYKLLSCIYILIITAGVCWSFIAYVNDSAAMNSNYLKAWVIKVPFDDDHVRFSWAVVIAILLAIKLFAEELFKKREGVVALFLIAGLTFYLHILAAKTGLITFYLSILIIGVYKIFTVKKKLLAVLPFIAIILLPILAYYVLPTFHNRINYILYDYQQYSNGNFAPGFPDGARVVSFIGGVKIFSGHIVSGIGFGDISATMRQWYATNYASFPHGNRIFPSNEYLFYACGAGIISLFVIIITTLYPFFIKKEKGNYIYTCFSTATILCFSTDINLEGQYGVFLYCFFALWLGNSFNKKQQAINGYIRSYHNKK